MNFTDNEKTSSVSLEETTKIFPEDLPLSEEEEKEVFPEQYERAVLPGRSFRRTKKHIILSVISGFVIVVLIAGLVLCYLTMSSKIKGLKEEIKALDGDRKLLSEEKGAIASEYEKKLSELRDEIKILEDEISVLSDKADFLDSAVRVVEDDGYKTYHVYGCEYFDSAYYWAYNKNQVVNSSEYTRCPYCN